MGEAYKYNAMEDDPIMSDGSSAFDGVVSATKENRIADTELAELINGDIGAYGTVGARPPASLIADNLSDDFYVDQNGVAYDTGFSLRYVGKDYISDTQKIWAFKGVEPRIFFFVGGKLFLIDTLAASTWGEPALEGINSEAIVCCAQLSNSAYFTDNSKLHVYEKSENNTWGFSEISNFKKTVDGAIVDADPLPPATCIETHVGRLCMAGITDAAHDPASVFFSDYLDGKRWFSKEHIQVGSDGDAIIALKSWRENNLLVFKRGSVWTIICSPLVDDSGKKLSPAYWTVNKISDSYGVVSRETITQVGNDVWFLSKRGVCSVQRAVAADANEMQALPISTPIQDVIDRINWEAAETASMAYFKDRVFLSVPVDSSLRPNIVLVYNTITQKWQGVWEGTSMRATGFSRCDMGGVDRLIWRTHDGSAYMFEDDETEICYDTCEGYEEYYGQEITTRAYTWGAPLNQKRVLDVELEFYDSDGYGDAFAILDGGEPIQFAEGMRISTSRELPQNVPFDLSESRITNFKYNLRHLPRFRQIQILIKTRDGRAKLRNVNLNGIVLPV